MSDFVAAIMSLLGLAAIIAVLWFLIAMMSNPNFFL